MLRTDRARRPRRIAADEAHAWARNLRLGNHHAKSVLRSLTIYVDGNGDVFTGIDQLADDCELSPDTVRRRLVWLEEIGAIIRRPQWLDQRGCRNSDGVGKRTTDLIKLCCDADQSLIEARARGEEIDEDDPDDGEFSPGSLLGLNPGPQSVSPAPALRQPSQSCEGLISEPEPESPLKAPQGARESTNSDQGEEPEDFGPSWEAWPGHEAMRRDLALQEFRLLSPDRQVLCRAAIPLFAAVLARFGRKHVPNFHLWIRTRGFEEFPNAKLAQPPPEPTRRWVCGDELAGLIVAARMADRRLPRLSDDPEQGRGYTTAAALRPDAAALARFADEDPAQWQIVELGTPPFAAWRDRLQLWLGGEVPARTVWREPIIPGIHDLPSIHPNFRLRNDKRGFVVPTLWPPRRDGTWAAEGEET